LPTQSSRTAIRYGPKVARKRRRSQRLHPHRRSPESALSLGVAPARREPIAHRRRGVGLHCPRQRRRAGAGLRAPTDGASPSRRVPCRQCNACSFTAAPHDPSGFSPLRCKLSGDDDRFGSLSSTRRQGAPALGATDLCLVGGDDENAESFGLVHWDRRCIGVDDRLQRGRRSRFWRSRRGGGRRGKRQRR
jgi:hypothetical protein